MGLREFVDDTGRTWTVWDSRPTGANSTPAGDLLLSEASAEGTQWSRFTPGREHGWLTFTEGSERRRLSPIPEGWEHASAEVLTGFLKQADSISPTSNRVEADPETGQRGV